MCQCVCIGLMRFDAHWPLPALLITKCVCVCVYCPLYNYPHATLNNQTLSSPGGDGEDKWRGYGAQCKSQAVEVVVAEKLAWARRHVTTSPRPQPTLQQRGPTHLCGSRCICKACKQACSSQRNDAARRRVAQLTPRCTHAGHPAKAMAISAGNLP